MILSYAVTHWVTSSNFIPIIGNPNGSDLSGHEHTLLDLRGNIPTFIWITHGKIYDVKVLDELLPEPGAFYIMDRAYLDFARLYILNQCLSFFVIRSKSNTKFRRIYSRRVDKSKRLRCEQTIVLTGKDSANDYPEKLRRVTFFDEKTGKRFFFLTNSFTESVLIVANFIDVAGKWSFSSSGSSNTYE